MFRKRVPPILWDYGMKWVCEIMQRTHLRANRVDGGVPLQNVVGETVNISNYLEFGFYDRVWFRDNAGLGEQKLGRWLVVAEHVGSIMTYHILQSNGEIVARSTVWSITNLEQQTDTFKPTMSAYDDELSRHIEGGQFSAEGERPDPEMWADLKENDEDFREEFLKIYDSQDIKDADNEPSPEIADSTYLNMELALPREGDGPELARVKRRKRDSDGNPIGRAHNNPILICEEMVNVRKAFEVVGDGKIPRGYTHIDCHLIFDVKLGENYRRKARFVAGGHQTGAPSSITSASVVSRDSVRICLLLAALNGLDVLACDIKGAYLTAPVREKVVTTAGPEFGPELEGKLFRATKALYGLKSAGAAFRAHLAELLHSMSYRPPYADPDVWLRPAVKPNGDDYYEYILTYCDDILCISMNPKKSMLQIREKFELKNDKIAKLDDYLGDTLSQMKNGNGNWCWTQSADKYLAASVKNVEEKLKSSGRKGLPLGKQCRSPFVSYYKPELDISPELKLEGHRYFQELIGMLRWGIKLGRLDILHEVSLLSAYLANPREGHLEAAIHIFGYLKHNYKKKLAFDSEHPRINEKRLNRYDWYDFYRDANQEEMQYLHTVLLMLAWGIIG